MTLRLVEWFCTSCKHKFKTEIPHPHCEACGSGYVARNEPIELSVDDTPQPSSTLTKG
jgi:rRNA maturation endonuclease Nob1